jgi:hypothetical protein
MRSQFTKFILRSLIALLPAIIMVTVYAVIDPFHVIHSYHAAYNMNDTVALSNNSGYIATEVYKLYRKSRHFDSFIFGSSMSQNFKAAYWQKYLPKNASICHYDASMETVEGIVNKIKYINYKGDTVKNALIIIEEEMLHRNPMEENFLYVQHYDVKPGFNWLHFQSLFFNIYKNPDFIKYSINPAANVKRMIANKFVTTDIPNRIEDINENYYAKFDYQIDHQPDKFFTTKRMAKRIYFSMAQPYNSMITGHLLDELNTLAILLKKNHTNYRIIIPPRYQRPQLNDYDLFILQQIFGQQHVYDFSHDEVLSNNLHYYYDDAAHLISKYCKQILDSSYCEPTNYIKSPYLR